MEETKSFEEKRKKMRLKMLLGGKEEQRIIYG